MLCQQHSWNQIRSRKRYQLTTFHDQIHDELTYHFCFWLCTGFGEKINLFEYAETNFFLHQNEHAVRTTGLLCVGELDKKMRKKTVTARSTRADAPFNCGQLHNITLETSLSRNSSLTQLALFQFHLHALNVPALTLANKGKNAQTTVTFFVSTNSTVHVSGLRFSGI